MSLFNKTNNMRIFIITIILLLLKISYSQENKNQSLSLEKKIFGLSEIWKEVSYNFPYLNESGVNWDSLYTSYIPKVANSKSAEEYYGFLNEFICVFHEGHTLVKPPIGESNVGSVGLAFTYINRDSSFYLIGYTEKYKYKVTLGSRLVSINNMKPKEYADSVFYSKHNYSKRIFYNIIAYSLLSGSVNDEVNLKLVNPNGEMNELKLTRTKSLSKWLKYKSLYRRKFFEFKSINDIAYVKLGSFRSFDIIKDFFNYADSINNYSKVIFDLRGNYGGTSYGNKIANLFTNDSSIVSYYKTRNNVAYYRALGMFTDTSIVRLVGSKRKLDAYKKYKDYYNDNSFIVDTIYEPNITQTRGVFSEKQVVILIDEFTASAAETFLIDMKNNCKVTFIGRATFGSTGQPIVISLPGGGQARIISSIPLLKNGDRYQFIIPDIEVNPSINDYLHNNDIVLKTAVSYFK